MANTSASQLVAAVCGKAGLGDNSDGSWALWAGNKPYDGAMIDDVQLCMAAHVTKSFQCGPFELTENIVDVTLSRKWTYVNTTIVMMYWH